MPRPRKLANPFRYFHSSPEVIRLVVMMYVRFPLSLRNVEDLLFERGIDICHETVRLWWNRFGPMFAADIRRQRVQARRVGRTYLHALSQARGALKYVAYEVGLASQIELGINTLGVIARGLKRQPHILRGISYRAAIAEPQGQFRLAAGKA